MARPKTSGPTERELDLLQVLWLLHKATPRDVHDALELEVSYSTVQTMLHVMFEKGLLERAKEGRSLVYRPLVSRDDVEQNLVGQLLERLFSGSAKQLLARALDVKKASKKELDEIQSLIDEARRP